MELVTAHFRVDDQLYEVDYYRAIGRHGGAKFFKVHKSERRCGCPDREALADPPPARRVAEVRT